MVTFVDVVWAKRSLIPHPTVWSCLCQVCSSLNPVMFAWPDMCSFILRRSTLAHILTCAQTAEPALMNSHYNRCINDGQNKIGKDGGNQGLMPNLTILLHFLPVYSQMEGVQVLAGHGIPDSWQQTVFLWFRRPFGLAVQLGVDFLGGQNPIHPAEQNPSRTGCGQPWSMLYLFTLMSFAIVWKMQDNSR